MIYMFFYVYIFRNVVYIQHMLLFLHPFFDRTPWLEKQKPAFSRFSPNSK